MAQNVLKDVANTLPHMIMGERTGYADLETLANLPDGRLTVDLLTCQAVHSHGDPVTLEIFPRLSGWLADRLGMRKLGLADLTSAELILVWRTDTMKTDRTRVILFDWVSQCTIVTQGGKSATGQTGGRTWYDRDRRVV